MRNRLPFNDENDCDNKLIRQVARIKARYSKYLSQVDSGNQDDAKKLAFEAGEEAADDFASLSKEYATR